MVSGWCLDDGMWMEPEELKRVEHRCGDRIIQDLNGLVIVGFKGWMTLRRHELPPFSAFCQVFLTGFLLPFDLNT